MDIPTIDSRLRALEHYRTLGERLMPLLEADEKIPGAAESVRSYLALMIKEIEVLEKRKQLVIANPDLAQRDPVLTPEQRRRLTLSQIELYEKCKALGMSERDSIRYSLDPKAAMFKKFDDLAIIYDINQSDKG